jgi:flagellar biosynthesis protein FlhA
MKEQTMPDDNVKPDHDLHLRYRFIAISALAVTLVLLIPFPALILDILWGLNLFFVLLHLLVTLYSKKVNDFSLLPTSLLVLTIFNLLLQISFARLILTKGEAFDGKIICALSSLMMLSGGVRGLLSGYVSFISLLILTIIFVTKLRTRISEVAARWTLDSCACKHMAIDTEYVSGAITEGEAIARRNDLQRESDFFGAMDGAGKFISGYLKVCPFITALSIIGGIVIGTLLKGETIFKAMMTYVPLFLCNSSLALFICFLESNIAGFIVTKAVLADEQSEKIISANELDKEPSPPDPIRVELGFGLIPLVDKGRGAEFLELLQGTRLQLLEELKIEIPKIRIIDNILLETNEYRIFIKGAEAGRWILKPDCSLCIDSGGVKKELPGEKVCEPVSALPAIWVSADQREEAELLGYTVVDPGSVLASHLKEIIKQRAVEFQDYCVTKNQNN